MLTIQEIKHFIDTDAASKRKRLAKVGQRYYDAEHDIKNYRVFYFDANGALKEDKLRSNFKISHPFFTELTDQEVQYMLSSKESFIRSDIPELQQELDAYFNENEDFVSELYEILTDTIVKGTAYAYAYKGENGHTSFQCADSMGVVEVRAKETQDNCDYVIYWYVERRSPDNKEVKRIQVWDKAQTYYYSQLGERIELDEAAEVNPRPHILYTTGDDTYQDDYGIIPFFRMDNNRKQISGLRPIKDIIDDYDLMNAGLTNNIQDANEVLYVVKGFQGDNLDELMTNIKSKKHIGVDSDGGVDVQTFNIPTEARKIKMEIDEKNIFRFGMGVNTENLKDTSATTSIAIKSAYSLLDLKCNRLEIRLKQFMRKLLKLVLAEINVVRGTDYSQKDVYFKFDREIIANAVENAQIELTDAQKQQVQINTLLNLANHLDNETLMQLICESLDIEYEEIKDKLPKPEPDTLYEAQTALGEVLPEDDVIE